MYFKNLWVKVSYIKNLRYDFFLFWHAHMRLIFILALANFFWGENGSESCPIFIILTFYDFRTMFPKNLCDEVSKIKHPRCTFSSIFHADPQEIFFIRHYQPFLEENWPRKRAIFIFFYKSMIFENLSVCFPQICVTKFPK